MFCLQINSTIGQRDAVLKIVAAKTQEKQVRTEESHRREESSERENAQKREGEKEEAGTFVSIIITSRQAEMNHQRGTGMTPS